MNKESICQKCNKPFPTSRCSKNKFCSYSCYHESMKGVSKIFTGKSAGGWNKGMKLPHLSGEKSGRYIKDRTKIAKRQQRSDTAYKDWRKQVWLRDNFKCKIANPDCKGRIEAHHILGWKDYPELHYQVNNGITLCHAHHPKKREDEAKLSPFFQSLVLEKN